MNHKYKTLIVCKEDLLRSLAVIDLRNVTNIDIVGSCEFGNTYKRFCKIYKPEIILVIVNTEDKLWSYKVCSYARENIERVKIIVVANSLKGFENNLYIRYGASAIYENCDDIQAVFSDLEYIGDTKVSEIIKSKLFFREDTNYDMHISDLMYLMHQYSGYGMSLINVCTDSISIQHNLYTINPQDFLKYIIKYVRNRTFPRDNLLITNYPALFPETFNKVHFKGDTDKNKCGFMFNLRSKIREKLSKIGNIYKKLPKNWEKSGIFDKNPPIFDGFKYDENSSILFINWLKNSKKEVKND